MLEVFIFATLNGLVTGLLLFMLASGLTLIFSMMGILNFAHASFYMLGAYFAYSISLYFGFWTGLIFAPLIVGVLGALVERYGLRRVHQFGHVAELVFTFGMAFLIEEAVQLFWGPDTKNYQSPDLLDFPLFTLFGQEFPAYRGFYDRNFSHDFYRAVLPAYSQSDRHHYPSGYYPSAHGSQPGTQRTIYFYDCFWSRDRASRYSWRYCRTDINYLPRDGSRTR